MAGLGKILASITVRCPHCSGSVRADPVVDEAFRRIVTTLKEGERVQVTGFGSFNPGLVKGRTVAKPPKKGQSTPATEYIETSDRNVVRFSMSPALKAAMNDEPTPTPRTDRGGAAEPKPKSVVGRRTGKRRN